MVSTIDESCQPVGGGAQPMMMPPSFGYPFMPFPSVPPPPMWQPLPIVVMEMILQSHTIFLEVVVLILSLAFLHAFSNNRLLNEC